VFKIGSENTRFTAEAQRLGVTQRRLRKEERKIYIRLLKNLCVPL